MRKCKSRRLSWTQKIAVLAVIFALAAVMSIFVFKSKIGPNIDAVSHIKAKGIITEIISETIREEFSGKDYEENLFKVRTGEDGKIQLVQSNTSLINEMVATFTSNLQKKYDSLEPREIKIAYGSLMGSKLLSELDFDVGVKILPLSVSKCDFETEFESQGINQTKYKIYITIESNVRVLEPFSAESFKVSNKMLISEIVIVGEVPGSYVNVPEDDILDVT